MKDIEELKKEQQELKARLHDVIEFTNSDEYFTLSPREKSLIGQQRAGMEMYLNALTNRIYSKDEFSFDATVAMLPMLMSSMFTGSSSFGGSSAKFLEDALKKPDVITEREMKSEC